MLLESFLLSDVFFFLLFVIIKTDYMYTQIFEPIIYFLFWIKYTLYTHWLTQESRIGKFKLFKDIS